MINLVRRKSDNVVLFAGDTYSITESGLVSSAFKAPTITEIGHEIVECESIPDDWKGGWYAYNGEWVLTEFGTEQKAANEPSFEDLKSEIEEKINAQFEAETSLIKGRVTQNEIDTFITQETEALAYQNDNNATVPLISGLAAMRGLTLEDLSQRILAHAAAYKTAIAQAMGKKHVLEDQLDSAQTINDLKSIEV